MGNTYSKKLVVAPSMSDGSGLLSIHSTFGLFMDIAMEHATELGIGLDYTMSKGLFWITVRTRVKFNRRPKLSDVLTEKTWPERPNKLRTNRYYTLSDNDGVAVEGKTEWAVINLETGRPQPLGCVFADDFDFSEEKVCEEPFMRISEDFSECPALPSFIVGSSDIDMARHMNNVMYVRELLNLFSTPELEEMNITEMEVCYRASCYEGDVLTPRYRRTEDGMDFGITRPDGKASVLIHAKFGNESFLRK